MTTIEIFKTARITRVDRKRRAITASGVDSVTHTIRSRTLYVSDSVLEKAERYLSDQTRIIVDVDSSTKNIDLRVQNPSTMENVGSDK